MASGDNALTIDVICKKLNHWYEKSKGNEEEKSEREIALGDISSSISKVSLSVVSMFTNWVIVDVQSMKKKMTMKNKQEK